MTLASITLASGRDVDLTSLEIFSTYDGMMQGYPCALTNDRLLKRLASRPESAYWTQPVHVIAPSRDVREPDPDGIPLPFGPMEVLPAVYCRARFRSHPVDDDIDPVLHRSYLTVVWFQASLRGAPTDFVTDAVIDLPWHELAEDREL